MKTITKVIFYFLIFVFVIVALSFFLAQEAPGTPTATLSVLSYTNVSYPSSDYFAGNWLQAKIDLQNKGKTSLAISISPLTESPGFLVKAHTSQGWETNCYWGMTPYTEALGPGENDTFQILLPTNTLSWQFSSKIYPASFREWILYSKDEHKSWNPLFWISGLSLAIFPEKEREPVEVKSAFFEISTNIIVFPKN